MTAALARAELARGIAAREAGNFAAAQKAFETVIALDPGDPAGFLFSADMQLRQGRHKLAVKLARTGLGLPCSQQNRGFGLQIMTLAHINLRQIKQALAAGAEAVRTDPINAHNRRIHAQALWAAKRFKAAEAEFQQALALAPEAVQVLTGYARFLKAIARLGEARELAERAALIEPDAFDVILLRGQIAFRYDELDQARDLALWALSRQATNKAALELLAMIKSRRSWLTGPFWWFANILSRYRKLAFVVIVLVFGTIGGLVPAVLTGQAALPRAGAAGDALIWGLCLYPLLCGLHVYWLVRRDLQQVKLKRNF